MDPQHSLRRSSLDHPPDGAGAGTSSVLHVLLRPATTKAAPADQSRHLISLLRDPSFVAVPKERHRASDICDKEISSLEGSSASRKRLLPTAGLSQLASENNPPEVAKGSILAPMAKEPNNDSQVIWDLSEDFDTKGTLRTGPVEILDDEDQATPQSHKKPSFPPSPPPVARGPWWRTLLDSPVKRLKLDTWGRNLRSLAVPKLTLPPQPTGVPDSEKGTKDAARRKDLPKRMSVHNIPKPTLKYAVKLAQTRNAVGDMVKRVEADFYANSSRGAKDAKRKTVKEVLKAGGVDFPLTPFSLKLLTGTLKESGYKSTASYLVEAKVHHIEMGHPWNALLDRNFKLCLSAAKRGVGPRKKAAEVPENTWANADLLPDGKDTGTKVCLAGHLFACGTHWMLREIELAGLSSGDIEFDSATRTVTLLWRESKMDTSASGIKRTLQCVCPEGCDMRCPYAVLETLVSCAALKGAEGASLAVTKGGKPATKSDIVKSWKHLYGFQVTGHSARRSGALQYIRRGWPVSQVAYLGRWKSNVILEYAQEALESMALNTSKIFKEDPTSTVSPTLPNQQAWADNLEAKADVQVVERLKLELASFKKDTKGDSVALSAAIKEIEEKMATSAKYLPPLVKSNRHQVIHKNHKSLVFAPHVSWRTVCGWYYYNANYTFEEGDDTKELQSLRVKLNEARRVATEPVHLGQEAFLDLQAAWQRERDEWVAACDKLRCQTLAAQGEAEAARLTQAETAAEAAKALQQAEPNQVQEDRLHLRELHSQLQQLIHAAKVTGELEAKAAKALSEAADAKREDLPGGLDEVLAYQALVARLRSELRWERERRQSCDQALETLRGSYGLLLSRASSVRK
eukprot:s218_g39.t1